MAQESDVIIAVMGEKALMSGESRSRAKLNLPGVQEQLLERLAATGKPGCGGIDERFVHLFLPM